MHPGAEAAETHRQDPTPQGHPAATLGQINHPPLLVIVAQDPLHPEPLPGQQPHLPHLRTIHTQQNQNTQIIEQSD